MPSRAEIISLNVGLPRVVSRHGEPVSTGIYKEPVEGRIKLRTLNFDGDRQADLRVHGGPYKAVYGYPSEHYDYWRRELGISEMPWGMFGENLTTTGLFESELNIGDKFQLGTATLMVTQPRMPCYKLALRFGRNDILRKLLKTQFTGFYFSVLEEGEVGVHDQMISIERDSNKLTIKDATDLYTSDQGNADLARRAIDTPALPESWKDWLRERLS